MKKLLAFLLILALAACNDNGSDAEFDPCAGVPPPCPNEKKGLIDSAFQDTIIIHQNK